MTNELITELVESQKILISDISPDVWVEQNRILTKDETSIPGPFSFENAPFTREILKTASVDHPAKKIAIMKGAQIGMSKSFIENAIGFWISEQPGNILFLTGHSDLSVEAVDNLDTMIDNSAIRHLIRSSTKRAKSQKTGDTNTHKEFPGGKLWSGSAGNHKLLRQRSARYIIVDDFEAAKGATKEAGNTQSMIEQRAAAYFSKMKIYFISSPELRQGSNILSAYLQGDQRKFHVSCPCCKEKIVLEWEAELPDGKKAGMTWKIGDDGKLLEGSVGYICQKCGEFFDDRNKHEMLNNGEWIPTSEPAEPDFYSYHISSMYSMAGSYNWEYYVRQYLYANPPGAEPNEDKLKSFTNLVLGETYEGKTKEPKSTKIQANTRPYAPNEIPEIQSEQDGNGKIILITCAADLNGKMDDARLDYEIVGWSETGASYSVEHGSIGTFVPREGQKANKVDRKHWNYEHGREWNVWTKFDEVLSRMYTTDTGRKMRIFVTALDCGYFTQCAYEFLDRSENQVVGAKGKPKERWMHDGKDTRKFNLSQERSDLYILETNKYKDLLADYMDLNWADDEAEQPANFMNFPTPTDGLYTYASFFAHFEGESRQVKVTPTGQIQYKWEKVNSAAQNHFWDCRIYNLFCKDYFSHLISKELKSKPLTWTEVADVILDR